MLLIREVSTKNRKFSLIFNRQAMKEINKKNLSVWPGEKERETERESNLCFVCLGRISLGNYRLGLFGGGQSIWQNDTCAEDKSPSDQLSFLHVSWFKILVLTDCSRFDARHQKDFSVVVFINRAFEFWELQTNCIVSYSKRRCMLQLESKTVSFTSKD